MDEQEKTLIDEYGMLSGEALLPDGFKEGEDYFSKEDLTDEIQDQPDEVDLDGGNEPPDSVSKPETDPTTTKGEQTEQNEQSHGPKSEEPEPDGARSSNVEPRRLKLKVDRKDFEINLDEMSNEEIAALMQKGYAFDRLKRSNDERRFKEVYDQLIADGESEIAAKHIAAMEVGGGYNPDAPAEEEPHEAPPTEEKQEQHDSGEGCNYQRELKQLQFLYPDVKEIPDSVAEAVKMGIPVISAYQAYRNREQDETIKNLEQENKILKQQAEAMEKAPVSGVTGGGVSQKKPDAFLTGLGESPW